MTDKCGSRLMAMGDSIGNCQLCEDLLSDLGKARADNERLRTALAEIITLKPEDMPHAIENSQAAAIARRALEPKP